MAKNRYFLQIFAIAFKKAVVYKEYNRIKGVRK